MLLTFVSAPFVFVRALLKGMRELVVENLALRQQLAVLKRNRRRQQTLPDTLKALDAQVASPGRLSPAGNPRIALTRPNTVNTLCPRSGSSWR